MGIEAGVQRQKSRRQLLREQADESEESLRRSWRAVNKARIVFGLAAAPMPAFLLFAPFVLTSLWDDFTLREFFVALPILFGPVVLWFVGPGSLFLIWLGHRYAVVERFHCPALCATLTFLLPIIVFLLRSLVLPWGAENIRGLLLAAFGGLALAPLGLLGGWLLWRIAIRPAEVPLREVAKVF